MTVVQQSKAYESLLKFPVRTIKSHAVDFIFKEEKLILPLGSCTSTILLGSSEKNHNVIGANHIQIGQPYSENKNDAYKLLASLLDKYKNKYNILPHQIKPLFFIGGRSSENDRGLLKGQSKILDPGKSNMEHTLKALQNHSLQPIFQFTKISIAIHLIMKDNLLFALIRNNEISHKGGVDCRLFYEFIILDMNKVYRKEFRGAFYNKPLRKHKHIYSLTDLMHAFYNNDLESYSYYDGLFYITEI